MVPLGAGEYSSGWQARGCPQWPLPMFAFLALGYSASWSPMRWLRGGEGRPKVR